MIRFRVEQLPNEDLYKLEEIASLASMPEPIDERCNFFIAYNGDSRIYGFVGINLNKPLYPQFEHIVIHPVAQKSRLGVILMGAVEKFLKEKNYGVYVCYILNTMNYMMEYAVKFGFKPYSQDNKGVWFYKTLIKE